MTSVYCDKCGEPHNYPLQVYECNVCGNSGFDFKGRHCKEIDTDTGVKFDIDKPRWDLVPPDIMEEVVHVLTMGAEKYSDDNWRKVPDRRRRYYAACRRHVEAWWKGQSPDDESGRNHLAHAICCLLFLGQLDMEHDPEVTNHKETDNA